MDGVSSSAQGSPGGTPLVPCTVVAGDLVLRPLEAGDERAVGRAMTDPVLLRWAAGMVVVDADPRDRGRVWLQPRIDGWSRGTAAFAVTEAADGDMLGYLGLRDVHRVPDQAVAAYWITPDARGRGLASRALAAATSWAFTGPAAGGPALHRITLDHALANPASCRVAERAGFRIEGTMRESFVDFDGVRHDSHLHARLATDPSPATP